MSKKESSTSIKKPDYHSHEEFALRSRKKEEIAEIGIDPYPPLFTPTASSQELLQKFGPGSVGSSDEAEQGLTPKFCLAGRLVLFRAMGKNAFAHLQDGSGRIQLLFNRDKTKVAGLPEGEEPTPLKFIEKKIDLGDIIGVEGNLFYTHKGELTLFVTKFTLLTKTYLPLPDKHAGLSSKELRYRKRWLDLICNDDVKKTFILRSRILQEIRRYLDSQRFMEVETPVLQSIYGGAEAKPFTTTLNALDQNMFMRISLEIPLKKLIIGGFDRVFEMGKVFRNEGIDRTHNPEFTMLEAYCAYADYNEMMCLVENLFEHLATTLFGTTELAALHPETKEPITINVKAPWKRLSMKEAIRLYGNIDVDTLSQDQMRALLKESGHIDHKKLSTLSPGLLVAALFEVFAEKALIQPHHIIDHPIETTPFCKSHRDPKLREDGLVERFESFILTSEMANAYSELNDPEIQRELLEAQADRRERGDEEASPLDEEFIEAICQGMPPTGGVGIGIDRLVMLLTQAASIRDVLLFPWMKPNE